MNSTAPVSRNLDVLQNILKLLHIEFWLGLCKAAADPESNHREIQVPFKIQIAGEDGHRELNAETTPMDFT